MLKRSWNGYKKAFIQDDGRIVDRNANLLSTSEGQSYALLRAVWMRDRPIFDKVYLWTRNNLQMRGDKLFAWKWGKRSDGSWGVMDKTAATDADEDIALALLMATQVWRDTKYQDDGLAIVRDIWAKETADTKYGRVLLSGDWKSGDSTGKYFQINPSYFAPYAYRIFAYMDPDHPWRQVLDSSYKILERATTITRTNLPPDWLKVAPDADSIELFPPLDTRSDFGYEAIRMNWRLALDYFLRPDDGRPKYLLSRSDFLAHFWLIHKRMPGPLTMDGIERSKLESDATYGCNLVMLGFQNPDIANRIAERDILLTLNEEGLWEPEQDYYTQNWLWFGLLGYSVFLDQTHFKTIKRNDQENPIIPFIKLMSVNSD